jgi:hypothetical protein
MEDPVFGNIDNRLRPLHASNIFDDMDFADVPEDMRDILSVASDHTDEVVLDSRCFVPPMNMKLKCDDRIRSCILESPLPEESMGTKETSPLTTTLENSPRELNSNIDCSFIFPPAASEDSIHMVEFVPPAGSFVQKSFKRNNQDQEIAFQSPPLAPMATPPPRNARPSPSSKSAKSTTRSRPSKTLNTSNEPPPPKAANSYAFVPASGSFNKRAPRKSKSGIARDRDAVLKDVAIVAQNIAIEAQVEALFPESHNEQPMMSQLSASFSNLNNSILSFNHSFNNGVFVTKPASSRQSQQIPAKSVKSSKPKKAMRRASNPHEHYVPPAAPGQQVSQAKAKRGDEHRALPSVDSIFCPNTTAAAAPASKQKQRSTTTGGEQEFQMSSNSLELHLEKKPEEQNINHLLDPMWAELAQIDDPSMAPSSTGPSIAIATGKPPRADNNKMNTKASSHSKTSRTSKSSPDSSGQGQSKRKSSQRKHKAGRRSSHPKPESNMEEKQESWFAEAPTPVVS